MDRVLLRFLLFSGLFIVVSGITGSWVVSTRLLYGFYFFIYGNLGKLVLFGSIIFGLLIRNKLKDLEKLPVIKINVFYLAGSFLLIPVFFLFGSNLLSYQSFASNPILSSITHCILLFIPTFLLLGIFGLGFVKAFAKHFYKEILVCLGISAIYDLAIFQVWNLWPLFSDGVLQMVYFFLSLTSSNVQFLQPRTLIFNDFGVSIEKACSGLDSLFLFSSLYFLIAILDWQQIHKIKLILTLFPALMGLYLVNIFRVYLLIIIGAYVSPALAINLFHTYLGMVFFIAFFFVFCRLFYPWMKS